MAKKKKKAMAKKPVRGRRRHSRDDPPHKPPPPVHKIVDGPYEVIFIAEDKYKEHELAYWLNEKLNEGLELIGTMTVVGVRHQFACTHGTRFIFKRYNGI